MCYAKMKVTVLVALAMPLNFNFDVITLLTRSPCACMHQSARIFETNDHLEKERPNEAVICSATQGLIMDTSNFISKQSKPLGSNVLQDYNC